MKTLPCVFLCVTLLSGAAFGQATINQNPNAPDPPQMSLPTGTPRDGFFMHGTKVYMTRNGVTTLVEREMDFPNGVRVLPDGTITLRDGMERKLLSKQWLDFQGTLQDFTPDQWTASQKSSIARKDVGVSNRDGISVSGADVFITRNGISDKVTNETHLKDGLIVHPDGTVTLRDGKKISLHADQVLGFDGVLRSAPVRGTVGIGVEPSTNAGQ